jgi:hypothetical protein
MNEKSLGIKIIWFGMSPIRNLLALIYQTTQIHNIKGHTVNNYTNEDSKYKSDMTS